MLVFLDIDGVLRRIGSPLDVLDADCLGRLEAVVRAHPQVQIVVRSSWRLVYGLDAIRARFAPDIGARRALLQTSRASRLIRAEVSQNRITRARPGPVG